MGFWASLVVAANRRKPGYLLSGGRGRRFKSSHSDHLFRHLSSDVDPELLLVCRADLALGCPPLPPLGRRALIKTGVAAGAAALVPAIVPWAGARGEPRQVARNRTMIVS